MHESVDDAFTRGWTRWRALAALQPSIDAATLAVLEGWSDADVVALAAARDDEHWSEAEQLLDGAHRALGLDYGSMTREEVLAIVLREELLRYRSGATTLRRVTEWASEAIGFSDTGGLSYEIVLLGLKFEGAEGSPRRTRALTVAAQTEIDRFLAQTNGLLARWRRTVDR